MVFIDEYGKDIDEWNPIDNPMDNSYGGRP